MGTLEGMGGQRRKGFRGTAVVGKDLLERAGLGSSRVNDISAGDGRKVFRASQCGGEGEA